MQTIAAARTHIIQELKRAQVESPELTADLLIGFVLGWDRVRVLSHSEQLLEEDALEQINSLVSRRVHGEPLQYLTGEKDFFGYSFRVTPDVLIPRPETELLVEKALDLIREMPKPVCFADIGTGSGCIAISILREVPSAFCYAVDRSVAALKVATENALRHRVNPRIAWVCSDLFECWPRRGFLDLILSNPPYVPLRDYGSLPSEVKDFEPHQALFAGEYGLDIYSRLIPEGWFRLVPGGHLLMELGAGQADAVGKLVKEAGFSLKAVVNDLRGIPRCLIAQKPLSELEWIKFE
jgi:release factor glutamine methyltransferase